MDGKVIAYDRTTASGTIQPLASLLSYLGAIPSRFPAYEPFQNLKADDRSTFILSHGPSGKVADAFRLLSRKG